jgi:hypothetical protein
MSKVSLVTMSEIAIAGRRRGHQRKVTLWERVNAGVKTLSGGSWRRESRVCVSAVACLDLESCRPKVHKTVVRARYAP